MANSASEGTSSSNAVIVSARESQDYRIRGLEMPPRRSSVGSENSEKKKKRSTIPPSPKSFRSRGHSHRRCKGEECSLPIRTCERRKWSCKVAAPCEDLRVFRARIAERVSSCSSVCIHEQCCVDRVKDHPPRRRRNIERQASSARLSRRHRAGLTSCASQVLSASAVQRKSKFPQSSRRTSSEEGLMSTTSTEFTPPKSKSRDVVLS